MFGEDAIDMLLDTMNHTLVMKFIRLIFGVLNLKKRRKKIGF